MSLLRIWDIIVHPLFLLGFLEGVLGSSSCFSGRLSVWYAFNYYLQIDWISGIMCRITSRTVEPHSLYQRRAPNVRKWVIHESSEICFECLLLFFTLPIKKSRANSHPTTSCFGMRNPPQKIDPKVWSAGLVQEMYLKPENKLYMYKCNLFKHVQLRLKSHCSNHHKISEKTSTNPSGGVSSGHILHSAKLRSSEGSKTLGMDPSNHAQGRT